MLLKAARMRTTPHPLARVRARTRFSGELGVRIEVRGNGRSCGAALGACTHPPEGCCDHPSRHRLASVHRCSSAGMASVMPLSPLRPRFPAAIGCCGVSGSPDAPNVPESGFRG
jgi:hypothetical protein